MRPFLIEPLESRIAPAAISIAPQSITEGDSTKTFNFVLTLSEAVPGSSVTVHYDLVAGSATAGMHYQETSGTATFAAGQTSTTIPIQILGDQIVNPDRNFSVKLSDPVNATLGTTSAITTIQDDDVQVNFSGPVDARNVLEGNAGVTPVSFTVSLSAAASHAIAVPFSLVDGTATLANGDFQYVNGVTTVTFAAGETSKTFTIGVVGDTIGGADEDFQVKLGTPTLGLAKLSATPADIVRAVSILNDDSAATTPVITIGNASGVEGGNAIFTVSLSAASESAVTVKYITADSTGSGAAIGGTDYTSQSGTLSINAGKTQTLAVPLTRDATLEGPETFLLKLSDATGGTLDPSAVTTPATGTINDIGVGLKVSNVTVLEGAEGTSTAIFTLTLDKPSGSTVTLGYDTIALSNTSSPALSSGANPASPAGTHNDFVPITDGSLTFGPTETTKTISVQIVGDTVLEANEQFGLHVDSATITDAANTTAVPVQISGTSTGVGTIQNDEGNNLTATITAQATTLAEGDTTTPATNQAHFTVELSSLFSEDVKVAYTVLKDGVSTTDILTIPAFTKTGVIDVTFLQDDVITHDQQIAVTLNGASVTNSSVPNATFTVPAATKTARTSILEDDAFVRVVSTLADGKAEGTGGTSLYPFRVELVDAANNPVTLQHGVTVNFATVDGLGTNGAVSTGSLSDFTAINRAVTVNAGQSASVVNVAINPDNLGGVDELFSVNISNSAGATLKTGATTANGKILDDDGGATLPVVTYVLGTPGQEGANTDLTFKLSRASDSPVTFSYATMLLTGAGAAVAGDFTATSGTATITPGVLSTTISVPITQEAVGSQQNEGQERFGFKLSGLSNTAAFAAGAADLTVEGLIAASDQPTLSLENYSAFEGQNGDTTFTFTVKLSVATDVDVVFDLNTFDITATAGIDYVAQSLTGQSIAATTLTKTFAITVKGDTLTEADEVFGIRVSGIQNAVSANGLTPTALEANGTIKNDDSIFSIVSTDTDGKVSEAAGLATFKISRTGEINLPASVSYATAEGPAGLNGAMSTGPVPDFTAITKTVTFAAGERDLIVTVPILNDDRHEADQAFSVKLTGGTNGQVSTDAAGSSATVTITDNDAIPEVLIATPASVKEGDSGTTLMNFAISLSRANDEVSVVVSYSTVEGTATAGRDFVAKNDSVTFAPGETTKTVSIAVNNDIVSDSARLENFQLQLGITTPTGSTPSATFVGNAGHLNATGTILDNESAPVVSISAATLTEGGPSTLVASLSHPSDHDVTVRYYTTNGTAVAGPDFTGITKSAAQTLTIPALQTTANVPITTTSDSLVEGNENFRVTLLSPSGAALSPTHASALATIADDDTAFLTINDLTIQEGDSGTKDAIFTVSLIGSTVKPVTVDFATAAGTALAGYDFVSSTGTLTLGGIGGPATAQIVVKVIGDLAKEGGTARTESFNVKLSQPAGASLIKDTGLGTIADGNDTLTGLTISNGSVVEGSTGSAATRVKFTATLDTVNTTDAVTFKFSTAEIARIAHAAQPGKDFQAVQDQLVTIPKNSLSVDFFVNVVQDDVFETVEFFNVNVSSVTNATAVNQTATGTIHDDDLYRTARLAKWTDVDGDVVTLAVTKGNLLRNVLFFKGSGSAVTINPNTGGRILAELDLAQAGQQFFGADLTVISTQQPDFTGALTGNGRVDIGYLRANDLDTVPTALEISGIDLGRVTIDGDLSRINAGDLFDNKGVNQLNVYSLGVSSSTTDPVQPSAGASAILYTSNLLAGANSIEITTDLVSSLTASGLASGSIGKLTIGGKLKGGSLDSSGRVNVTGTLGSAVIGSIEGGSGALSGSIVGIVARSILGNITVKGSITAGSGVESATITSPVINSLTVGGSLHGSAAGGLVIANKSLGNVTIQGDMDLNAQIIGGGTKNDVAINKVVVHGNVSNAKVLAGYSYGQSSSGSYGAQALSADAKINLVQVDGSVANFDIAAGVFPGNNSSFGSGVIDKIGVYSRIAQVVLNGSILTNTSAFHYITAQQIDNILVAGQVITPTQTGAAVAPGSNFLAKLVLQV